MADFADYYREIYVRGLGGETPSIPVSIAELERRAAAAMDERAANYVFAGAGSEGTMDANREAFARRRIVPRMLRDVAERDLSTTLLGTPMPAPLMLAPIGVQKVVHPDGELATARAAASLGLPMIASTASAFTLEEIAEAGGDAPRWFQLYWKPRDLQQAWLPFLNGVGVANYFQDPVFREALEKTPEEDPGMATGHFLGVQANPALSWDDLAWLREQTSLPIVIKGIQHADDAREAAKRGIDGIVVSNHGGRQVDGAIGSLDALPAIAEAAGDDLTILFDSGIRSGSDAIKALALGADAVCLGRPYIWGLALEGQAGVETILKMVLAELDLTMALCGYTEPSQLSSRALTECT
jgi:L-lactate dehydrogenase (cytochrome)